MRQIDEISKISAQYDGYLIDLWGVTHDGQRPFPGVIDALTHLQEQNKQVSFSQMALAVRMLPRSA